LVGGSPLHGTAHAELPLVPCSAEKSRKSPNKMTSVRQSLIVRALRVDRHPRGLRLRREIDAPSCLRTAVWPASHSALQTQRFASGSVKHSCAAMKMRCPHAIAARSVAGYVTMLTRGGTLVNSSYPLL